MMKVIAALLLFGIVKAPQFPDFDKFKAEADAKRNEYQKQAKKFATKHKERLKR